MRALRIISIVFGWLMLLLELVAVAMAGFPSRALLSLDTFLVVVLPFICAGACVWFCMATLRLHRLVPAPETSTLDQIDSMAATIQLPLPLKIAGTLSLLGSIALGVVLALSALRSIRHVLSGSYLFGMGWIEALTLVGATLICIAIAVYTVRTLTMKKLQPTTV